MILTVQDEVARYRIDCPDACELRVNHEGTDFLLVPDSAEPEVPYWLFDEVLLEAARSGEFGLRLLSEELLE
ncbi:MAG TPA: hypothetical protein VK395_12720 [Gemmataceae bacterium]|nr:hypothetical protein [Gemmataceae bacterium]